MDELLRIIRNIKLLVMDVDGVLTDGKLYYSEKGEHIKVFNVRDGQGIKLAQAYDLKLAVISGRECQIVNNRCNELGVTHVYQHCHDKLNKIKQLSLELKTPLNEITFIGDDILDVPVLEIVGLPVCPKDAHPSALLKSKIVTEVEGGNGCVREIIDLILKKQGKIRF